MKKKQSNKSSFNREVLAIMKYEITKIIFWTICLFLIFVLCKNISYSDDFILIALFVIGLIAIIVNQKITNIIWGIFCLLFSIMMCEDFYEALKHPDLYHFGAEGPYLWYYETQKLYLCFGTIMIFWSAIGFLFCLLQNKFRNLKWGITIHIFITLLYLFVFNTIISRYA